MKSTCELIQQLTESTTADEKKKHISVLKQILSSQNGNFVIGNVKKLFTAIENMIKDPLLDIVLETIDLLSLLLSGTDLEIEIHATKIQSTFVSVLTSDNFAVRAAAIACEVRYLKKSNNCEAVLSAINKNGIESSNENERANSGDVIVKLAQQYEAILDDTKNKSEMRKVVQSLITKMKIDPVEKVKKSCAQALIHLTQIHPGVFRVSRELPVSLISAYDELLQKEHVTVNTINSNGYSGIDNALTAQISKTFSADTSIPVGFGFIPERIINELSPTANWKQRAGAIEELEEILRNERNLSLLKHNLPSFFLFLVGLLNDSNYKVSVTTLQIISKKTIKFY